MASEKASRPAVLRPARSGPKLDSHRCLAAREPSRTAQNAPSEVGCRELRVFQQGRATSRLHAADKS